MSKLHKPTQRVVDILVSISNSKEGISFTEISEKTSIPKGTLSPILNTLVKNKMIYLSENNKRYSISTRSFIIGHSFVDNINTIDYIKENMKDIVDECDEICQLGILDGPDVLYVAKVEPVQAIKLESSVGKKLPAYATALGKCLLADYENHEIKNLYRSGFKALTSKTITDINELIEVIEKIRKSGFSYEYGESNEQVMCLAVPIKHNGKTILSISVSIPKYRVNQEKISKIEKILVNSRREIEEYLSLLEISDIDIF